MNISRRDLSLPIVSLHLAALLAILLAGNAGAGIITACFKPEPVPPWDASDIGVLKVSSSRPGGRDSFELCSSAAGFGPTRDELRFVSQPLRADFEVTARLDKLANIGIGGVMARLDTRTEDYPHIQISGRQIPGAPVEIFSSVRLEPEEKASPGNSKPFAAELPVWLRVRREGSILTTSFSRDGKVFNDHLQVNAEDTKLNTFFLYGGMVQASSNLELPSSAFFSGPRVITRETTFPPELFDVDPPSSPVEGGVEVTVTGNRLDGAVEASLAGVPARILRSEPGSLTLLAGQAKGPIVGDVVVETKAGSASLSRAFAYFGHTFLRGDFDGDLGIDIGDQVGLLTYLFLGGKAPYCMEGMDVDNDGELSLSDAVRGLGFLFLGFEPPAAPYPKPGIDPSPSLACALPPQPELLKISETEVGEGDLVTLTGRGFSPVPEENLVFFGDTPAEVIDASGERLVARVGKVAQAGLVEVGLFRDWVTLLRDCKLKSCRPTLVGNITFYTDIVVKLRPSKVELFGGAKPRGREGSILIPVDPKIWDPDATYEVRARLHVPTVYGLSRGNLFANFDYERSEGGFPVWLQGLAKRLQDHLGGNARNGEVRVVADAEQSALRLDVDKRLLAFLDRSWLESFVDILVFRPPHLLCGGFDPVTDRREYGWCRFADLIQNCGGLPKWEYFIPKHLVLQASGSIFPLPSPNSWSTGQKDALYNRDAYCHVRNEELYKTCVLEDLAGAGYKQVPHFPRPSIVVKTRWSTEASLIGAGKDPSKHYSYVQTSTGTRWYLTLFHFTDKSVDKWFWADFYVPTPSGGGGCGGSGADRPASITGVWANYQMCTSLEPTEPGNQCGNNVIGVECVQNCVSCHEDASEFTPSGSIKLDFLFSLGGGISGPPACP